jgi:frataxin-like iron-binding protein CyaY
MAKLILTIEVDDTQQSILNNDLVDINTWVQDAMTGKIHNCWKRMQREWTDKLMNDSSFTDPIPSNQTDFVKLILARSDYKNRKARDDES